MSYDGPERRTTPCKEHEKLLAQFDHDINGNGKPGLKADVEICLPRKQEVLLYAPMSSEQQTINSQLLEKTLGVRREDAANHADQHRACTFMDRVDSCCDV